MDLKFTIFVAVALVFVTEVQADIDYDSATPSPEALKDRGLICVPGRTVLKVGGNGKTKDEDNDSDEEEEEDTRRTHMNERTKDDSCQVCVCSAEGKDEYCSNRLARNVNECIRMATMKEKFEKQNPYNHERLLSQMIRRDYIWHRDEIPYDARAKCARANSYYSNDPNAANTDIDVSSDINDLLHYQNSSVCYYCVCSTDGNEASCISRDLWYCEYFRKLQDPYSERDMYRNLFQQDRPTYFRTLPYRVRRTMDQGMFDLVAVVGDELDDPTECIPFVSQYSDCTDANFCTGCRRCSCSVEGTWDCRKVHDCSKTDQYSPITEESLDNALEQLEKELSNKKSITEYNQPRAVKPKSHRVSAEIEDQLLDESDVDVEKQLLKMLSSTRSKRSISKKTVKNETKKNETILFHHTVDEKNEDTLKNSNTSGTIEATKVYPQPQLSRRTGDTQDKFNITDLNSLHIEYNNPQSFSHQITDNKLETLHNLENLDHLSHDKLLSIIGNQTQRKDKELSKLVVNELKKGSETIGDKNAPPTSNITFTSENDTLTAIAYIAGNLLSKLWSMEADASEDSIEVEVLRHEKIADLIDLFKEPLTVRQETFLKNALNKLSEAVDKDKDIENVSLCKKVEETKKELNSNNTASLKDYNDCDHRSASVTTETSVKVSDKINNVLDLIRKFQNVQNKLDEVKGKTLERIKPTPEYEEKTKSLGEFSVILEKLTNLLVPKKKTKKRLLGKIRGLFGENDEQIDNIERIYNINLDEVSLTPKDKLLIRYLNSLEKQPNCLLGTKTVHSRAAAKHEGDIIQNLSEFFKIKSYVDLLKIIDPEKYNFSFLTTSSTTNKPTVTTTTESSRAQDDYLNHKELQDNESDLETTKIKLKTHLKSIIEDLTELRRSRGGPTNNLTIATLLPCIYKILNEDYNGLTVNKTLNTQSYQNKINKIKKMFDDIKVELKNGDTRRKLSDSVPTSKAAEVWERIVLDFNGKTPINPRRSYNSMTPNANTDLKKMIRNLDKSQSSSVTKFGIQVDVGPADRITVLKNLQIDVTRYLEVLKALQKSLENRTLRTVNDKVEFNEFLRSAEDTIHQSQTLYQNMQRRSNNRRLLGGFVDTPEILPTIPSFERDRTAVLNTNMKSVTRDQIMDQLIINRVKAYIRSKEDEGVHVNEDGNYQLARKVISNMDHGNHVLARELYKIFAEQKLSNKKNGNGNVAVLRRSYGNGPQTRDITTPDFSDGYDLPKLRSESQLREQQDALLEHLLKIKNMKF